MASLERAVALVPKESRQHGPYALLILDHQNSNRGRGVGISIRHNGPLIEEVCENISRICRAR
jgi:hypothetical protein